MVALDDVVVAQLVVDPQPGLQGGVGQPADAAEGGRPEVAAPGREPGRAQPLGTRVEDRIDSGRERRAFYGGPAVALDEDDDDILPAETGQQIFGGGVAAGIDLDRLREC